MPNAYVALDSFTTTVNGQRRWVRRGRSLPGDDPIVIARPTLFRALPAFNSETVEEEPQPKRTYRRKKR
jgi:hypothetical protein